MRILAIVPARCGSKGIPDKNIIDICGKPLMGYSIEQGRVLFEDRVEGRLVVSTDCEKIAAVAREYGAEVPFLRPEGISGDKAKSIEFVLHALDYFEGTGDVFDAVLLLQPTAPVRAPGMLQEAIALFEKTPDAQSLISVYEEEYINDLVMYRKEGDYADALNPNHNKGVRRQDHGSVFVRNGAVYITSVPYLREHGMLISDRPLMIEMKKSESINIDTMEDVDMLRRYWCA